MEARATLNRSLGLRILVVAGAIAVGLVLQHGLTERVTEILARAEHDRAAARAELAGLLRLSVTIACGLTAALGLCILIACRKPAAAQVFPPPGLLSIGALRRITGPRATTFTRIGSWLGLALLVFSLAGVAMGWYLGAVLLACRA